MKMLRIVTLFILVLIVASFLPFLGNSPLVRQAEAVISSPVDGAVFYVTEGANLKVPLTFSGTLSSTELPPGANIITDPSGSDPECGSVCLDWTPDSGVLGFDLASSDPDDPADPPSAPFGIAFTVDDGPLVDTVEIMIIVKSAIQDQPAPTLELNKSTYMLNQLADVAIKDPNSLCNFESGDLSNENVQLTAIRQPGGGGPDESTLDAADTDDIEQDNEGSGDLVGEFTLTGSDITLLPQAVNQMGLQGNLDVKMVYAQDGCPGSEDISGTAENFLRIRSAGISFERNQYTFGETAVAIVTGTPLTGSVTATVYDNNIGTPATVVPDPADTDPAAPNRYLITVPPGNGQQILRVQYDYTVQGGVPVPYWAAANATLLERRMMLDNSSYYSDEGAILNMTDSAQNIDPQSVEMLDVSYTSSASGVTIAEGTIPQFLKETGPDTAIFVNEVYLYFARDGDPAPPGASIPVDRNGVTTIVLTAGTSSITTTVTPFVERGLSEGTGSTNENPPAGASYGAQLFTCANYGGDTDADGLCNNWEYPASGGPLKIPYGSFAGTIANSCTMPSAAGCPDSRHKDIFLEIDYVGTVSSTALTSALESIRTTFNQAPVTNSYGGNGIKLHYKIDENIGTSVVNVDVWGTAAHDINDFDQIKRLRFGTLSERNSGSIPTDNTYAKFEAFHWVLFAERQNQDLGSSGNGEVVGNDIIVTLRPFDSNTIDNMDQIRGTLMHELGHNLGLYHGGVSSTPGNNVNCKPNYPSVMTYIRQMTTAYGSQQYTDEALIPNPINANALNDTEIAGNGRTDVLTIPTASSAQSMIIVWSTNDGVTYPIATINRTSSQNTVNWLQDSFSEPDNPNNPMDPIKTGIVGCTPSTNAHGNLIYSADDWAGVEQKLNFRETNPQTAATGLVATTGAGPGEELSPAILTGVRVAGVVSLNGLIQNIAYQDFAHPYNNPVDAQKIQEEFECRLIKEDLACPSNYVDKGVSGKSVVDLIYDGDLETAITDLVGMRRLMDFQLGGERGDDLFTSTKSITPMDPPSEPILLPLMDNNIASLRVAVNLPFGEAFAHPGTEQSFRITTFDGNCAGMAATNTTEYEENCVIKGTALTLVNATDYFAYDSNRLIIDFIGVGGATLEIPGNIAKKINNIVSLDTGKSFPFTQNYDQTTKTMTLSINDTDYYPRQIHIVHDKPDISASLSADHCGGSYHALHPWAGKTSYMYLTAKNNGVNDINATLVLELRDGYGVTRFLNWSQTSLEGQETECLTIGWPTPSPPMDQGAYDARIFVLDTNTLELIPPVTSSKIYIYQDP